MSEPESKRGTSPDDRSREGEHGEEAPAFRVIDRRRFAPDGTERTDIASDERRETPAQSATVPNAGREQVAEPVATTPHAPPAAGDSGETTARATEGLGMPVGEAYGDEASLPEEPTFSTLIISLSTQALMLLGEIPDPSGEQRRDLASARHIIDLLGVLEKKTTGNLDSAETALFTRILYDLRMRFVEIARG